MKFIAHAMCQAMRLEGIPQIAETSIETRLRKMWESSGPDFVISYIKRIKSYCELTLADPDAVFNHINGEISISWNHKLNRPRGPIGYIFKRYTTPVERIRVLNAILNSIEFEYASKAQIKKFVKGVRSRERSDVTLDLPNKLLMKINDAIERRLSQVTDPFGPMDLTGTVLPVGLDQYSTSTIRKVLDRANKDSSYRDHADVKYAAAMFLEQAKGQLYLAPSISKKRWNEIIELAVPDRKDLKYPRKVTPRPEVARDYMIRTVHDTYMCNVSGEYDGHLADYLGRVEFLQQRGGKLRSIANVNRFVNYTLEPFAKALEDVFYNGTKSICVRNQTEGLQWCMQKLSEGIKLSSFDLTSATDLLDFRVLIRSFGKNKDLKILCKYLQYFEELAQLPLWCEELDTPVQFFTGQPLGMKGSFQFLTIMNYLAGWQAMMKSGLQGKPADHFRLCGDDFVCDSRMSEAYDHIIRSWCGKTNAEKCLNSDKYAEFLSKIITRNNIYSVKPKYHLSRKAMFINLQKCKFREYKRLYSLNKNEETALNILSEFSVDEFSSLSNLPSLKSKDYTIPIEYLEWISHALSIISELREFDSSEYEISFQAVDLAIQENISILNDSPAPVINNSEPSTGLGFRDGIATLPTEKAVFDHKKGKHVVHQSYSSEYNSAIKRANELLTVAASMFSNIPETLIIQISKDTGLPAADILLLASEYSNTKSQYKDLSDFLNSQRVMSTLRDSYINITEKETNSMNKEQMSKIKEGLNQLSARSKERLAKQLINANSEPSEVKRTANKIAQYEKLQNLIKEEPIGSSEEKYELNMSDARVTAEIYKDSKEEEINSDPDHTTTFIVDDVDKVIDEVGHLYKSHITLHQEMDRLHIRSTHTSKDNIQQSVEQMIHDVEMEIENNRINSYLSQRQTYNLDACNIDNEKSKKSIDFDF